MKLKAVRLKAVSGFTRSARSGFTLVEMLVVVAIVGILSSVLIVELNPARDKARDARIMNQVNQVRTIAEALYDGNYDGLEELPKLTSTKNQNIRALEDDIKNQGGELVIRKNASKKSTQYVIYSKLNETIGEEPDIKIQYFCLESSGRTMIVAEEPAQTACSR